MFENLASDFTTLLVIIDPIGLIPIFLALTGHRRPEMMRSIALRSVLISAVILFVFLGIGQALLAALGISIPSFRVAGGIILFLVSLEMIFGSSAHKKDVDMEDPHSVAVFPLAIPSIAGPGTIMAVILLSDKQRFDIMMQIRTGALLAAVLVVTLVTMWAAVPIQRVLRRTGIQVLSRVMGLLLAALSAEYVLQGLKTFF